MILIIVHGCEGIQRAEPAAHLHMTWWQNTRYKLAQPRVQVWTSWVPCLHLDDFHSIEAIELPILVQLSQPGPCERFPIDGGLDSKTSYGLAQDLASCQFAANGSCWAYKCQTRAIGRNQREVFAIDHLSAESPIPLFSPGLLFCRGMRGGASGRMSGFADRDAVLQQMFAVAASLGGGGSGAGAAAADMPADGADGG